MFRCRTNYYFFKLNALNINKDEETILETKKILCFFFSYYFDNIN